MYENGKTNLVRSGREGVRMHASEGKGEERRGEERKGKEGIPKEERGEELELVAMAALAAAASAVGAGPSSVALRCGAAAGPSRNLGCSSSAFAKGTKLQQQRWAMKVSGSGVRAAPLVMAQATAEVEVESPPTPERFRLGNLSPQPGSRKRNKRKGRGIAAGQGASCGFGMRGQKSRSGSGVRPGFEGGQMPLYRRLPKLKGIAGGMGAGLSKFVTVNLDDIEAANFSEGEEVSLETLIAKRILNPSGREERLRLKVLGNGELTTRLTIKAGAFSESARAKLETVGSTLVDVPGRKKWVKPSVQAHQTRAEEYFAKKRASDSWVEK